MGRVSLIAVVLAFFFARSGDSFGEDEIRGCYHEKTGKLRVETPGSPCRSKEVPLSWNRTGPSGPAGESGPPGPMGLPGGSLEVRDANETFVGTFVGDLGAGGYFGGYGAVAVREIDGDLVPLLLLRDELLRSQVHLIFETSNCTGTQYVSTDLAPPPALFDGSTIYYATGTPETRVPGSHVYGSYTQQGCSAAGGTFVGGDRCCFHLPSHAALLSRVGSIAASELGLVPPFHVVFAAAN